MDIYHNGNFRGGRRGSRLTPVPVQRTFLWEGQEIYIPAIYVGKAGAVLDVCAKIPVEEMTAFLKKWPRERRLSLKTPEEYEQIDADHPGSRDFLAEMSLDDMPLTLASSCSINWYPRAVFQMGNEADAPAQDGEWENDKDAEELLEAYGCDRAFCWHFGRLNYNWKEEPILSPRQAALEFRMQQVPVTAGYFTTSVNTSGQLHLRTNRPESLSATSEIPVRANDGADAVKAVHPVTGQEYTLTLHECQQTRHSFDEIGAEDVSYPEYGQLLSYSISPEIDRQLFDIRDCSEGDRPRKKKASKDSGSAQGAAAVFMAGKSAVPERRMAASSLHFEPVEEVRWRMVFQVQRKGNLKIAFPV